MVINYLGLFTYLYTTAADAGHAPPIPFYPSPFPYTLLALCYKNLWLCLKAFSGQQKILTSMCVEQEKGPECPRNKATFNQWPLEVKFSQFLTGLCKTTQSLHNLRAPAGFISVSIATTCSRRHSVLASFLFLPYIPTPVKVLPEIISPWPTST